MSSYAAPSYLPQHQPTPPSYYTSATPPAPPPKPSSTEVRGPPPPPLPGQHEVSELDANQSYPNQQQYQQSPPPQQQQQVNIPVIEAGWLPEGIRDKSSTDLHHLLTNTELLASLLNDANTTHPSIPASQQPLLQLLDSNTALSNHLLTLETQLKQQRSATQSRLLALKALEQQHRAKIEETERALQQFSPMALYQRLSASVGEQENLVRGVEESWMEDTNGNGEGAVASSAEVESFVRRVREARKVSFLRRERKGRWDEGRVGGWR